MFTYQKLVHILCYDEVDKDSLSIIEKFSIFYINHDFPIIYNFLKKYIIQKYDLNFFHFLIFNIKSIQIFNSSKNGITSHFKKNKYINFTELEDEIFHIINDFFSSSNFNIYDIKFFIRKYFWNHIITDRFEFIQNPHKWEYIDNSQIFLKNILIDKLKLSQLQIQNFIKFIQYNYNFENLSIKNFNLHFEDNLRTLNLDFGYIQEDINLNENFNLN